VRARIRQGLTLATCEYLLGYRAALRHLLEASDAPGNQLKKMKITATKTAEWLKLCHEHAFELAEGEILELWQTPEGKLFFKKASR
jgi:hypothetical protein